MKGRPAAGLIAAVLATACACSGAKSAQPSPSHSAKTATTPSHSPTFAVVTSGCVLSAQTVSGITGTSVSTSQPIQMGLTDSAGSVPACMYSGTQQGSTVLVGVGLEPVRPGLTPPQYLAENKLAQAPLALSVQQDVPGLGDAARFGTVTIGGETIGVVSLVQVRAGTVADLSVTVSGSSVSEDSVVALARAVLAAITH
jgi:hypothetical protein